MQAFNMEKQTLIKTNPISPQSIAYLQDKKRQLILISQPKSIHKWEEEIKSPAQVGSISCITVSDDLFFFAYGMHVAAAGYNGKVIFDFDTYIASDRIDRIHVVGYRLWIISGSILNQFMMAGSQLANKLSRKTPSTSNKVEDIRSHMFQSKINDTYAVEDEFGKHFLIVLKNNNQVITFQDKELTSYKTSSPPTTIIQYPKTKPGHYLVGTMSGEIIYIEINKKLIREIWVIREGSKGKINCLLEVKNEAIFVFRDQAMQVWSADKTMQASDETQDKYVSAIYLQDKQVIFAGSTAGNVTQMRDYTKMMKYYQKRSQLKIKEDLEKEVNMLKAEYEALKAKAASQKKISVVNEGINVELMLSIDYANLCSCLEVKSDSKISKIILKGKVDIVKCSKLVFKGKEGNKQESTYVIQEEEVNICKILLKSQQKYQKDQKLKIMVYGIKDQKTYGTTHTLDLRPLMYHHKVAPAAIRIYNELEITGEFKYFEIVMYLNTIFNQFGQATQNGEAPTAVYFESIFTKEKLMVTYKNGECRIKTVNPAPLVVIKQALVAKSKEKVINFNFSTHLNEDTIAQLVQGLQKIIKPMQELKKQFELLPGLLEIQNEEALSPGLREIIERRQQITKNKKQTEGLYESLIEQLKNIYISFQKLKQHEVSQFEMDLFNRQVSNFDGEKIKSMIQA